MKKKPIIIGAVCVAAVAGFAWIGASLSGADAAEAAKNRGAVPAQIEETKRETIITKISASGKVEFVEKTTLFARTGAKAKTVNFKAGDGIKTGDVLIDYDTETLDTLLRSLSDAELSVKTAEINLKSARQPTITDAETLQAESAVKNAQKAVDDVNSQIAQSGISTEQLKRSIETSRETLRKTKILYDGGLVSRQELDQAEDAVKKLDDQLKTAESQMDSLLVSLAAAESSLETAGKQRDITSRQISLTGARSQNTVELQEVQLEQARRGAEKIKQDIDDFKETEISEASGTILALSAVAGQPVQKGQQIAVVADTSWNNLVIVTYVPEKDTTNLAVGQAVEITGGALAKAVYTGKVTKILPLAEQRQIGNNQEAAVTVEIKPDDPGIPIKAGYTVDTNIITRVAENVVVAPLMAVMSESGGGSYVYVVKPDNTAERRGVTLRAFSNLYVEAEGVDEGERVILSPTDRIKDGVTVKASNY
jgi:HlyD family secretion protein